MPWGAADRRALCYGCAKGFTEGAVLVLVAVLACDGEHVTREAAVTGGRHRKPPLQAAVAESGKRAAAETAAVK
jgi:hypothetical protein